MKKIITILILLLASCSKTVQRDPVISISLTEERNGFRLETFIDTSGKVFQGYYHESKNNYEREKKFNLPSKVNKELWAIISSGTIVRDSWNSEPKGNFKTIGVSWQGKDSTYGTSYPYKELEKGSTLEKVLKILQDQKLDTWTNLN